jgi:hypothetical protein
MPSLRARWALLVLLLFRATAAADESATMRDSPFATAPLPDEDDPKLARGAASRRPTWPITRPVSRLKLSFQQLWLPTLDGGTAPFEGLSVEDYPVSSYLRLGIGVEAAFSSGTGNVWFGTIGASLGVQWPMRVTPFLEGRFAAGIIGGSYRGDALFGWIYLGGLDGGVEIHCWRHVFASAAIGWTHPVYQAVDVTSVAHGQSAMRTYATDSLSLLVGLGF